MRSIYYGKRDRQQYEIVGKGTFTTYEDGLPRVYPSVTLKNILTGVLSSTLEVHLSQFFVLLATDFDQAFSHPERFQKMVAKLGEMFLESDMSSFSKRYEEFLPAIQASVENHLQLHYEGFEIPEEFQNELESFAMSLFLLMHYYEDKRKKAEAVVAANAAADALKEPTGVEIALRTGVPNV